jgi:hypothetical protein
MTGADEQKVPYGTNVENRGFGDHGLHNCRRGAVKAGGFGGTLYLARLFVLPARRCVS